MVDLVPPIFVFSDDVASFESIDAVLRYVEPIDADLGLRIFDARGQEVLVQATDVKRSGLLVGGGHLEIAGSSTTAETTAHFETLLREHASALREHLGTRWFSDPEIDVSEASLQVLIEAVHAWTRTA